MIWGKTYVERKARWDGEYVWHRWYAWHPVQLMDGRWFWLGVACRRRYDQPGMDGRVGAWEYL